ncbi:unnamed protein product [Leuciscus chuanchicus]
MNAAAKHQPDLLERPASLLVPTWIGGIFRGINKRWLTALAFDESYPKKQAERLCERDWMSILLERFLADTVIRSSTAWLRFPAALERCNIGCDLISRQQLTFILLLIIILIEAVQWRSRPPFTPRGPSCRGDSQPDPSAKSGFQSPTKPSSQLTGDSLDLHPGVSREGRIGVGARERTRPVQRDGLMGEKLVKERDRLVSERVKTRTFISVIFLAPHFGFSQKASGGDSVTTTIVALRKKVNLMADFSGDVKVTETTKTGLALLYDRHTSNTYDVRLKLTKELLIVQKQDVVCVHGGDSHLNVSTESLPSTRS